MGTVQRLGNDLLVQGNWPKMVAASAAATGSQMESIVPGNEALMFFGLIFSITCAQLLVVYVLAESSKPGLDCTHPGAER